MELEEIEIEYASLGLDLPGFIKKEITIREIAMCAELDITEYMDRLDTTWIAIVYPTHHAEIVQNLWDGHPLEMLVAEEFDQHCFNFIMSATIGWCKKTVASLSLLLSSGNLVITNKPGQVLPFVRH